MTATWDIESIIDETEPAEVVVTICIKGNLRSKYDRLESKLGSFTEAMGSLAGNPEKTAIAEAMAELVEQMHAAERPFTLRGVTPKRAWRNLLAKRPVKTPDLDDEQYLDRYHPWVCGIVAASAADPVMTAEQVERLADKLSDGDWKLLANAAWSINDDSRDVPFSAAASALIRSSGGKSKLPEPSERPDHGSLAGNPSPDTSTTMTDD